MTSWLIEDLPGDRLHEAWPLIWLRDSALTLDRWVVEARSLLAEAPDAGVRVAQTPGGYIYAVSAWRVDPLEAGGSELVLPYVAYVQWNGAADPLGCLMAGIEDLAGRRACARIRLGGRGIAATGDTKRWERLGYRWAGEGFEKNMLPPGLPANVVSFAALQR